MVGMAIARRLIRTVPEQTTDQVESWWQHACDLHPTWEHVTHRDPLIPSDFPLTAPHWDRCLNGAQFAGLVRLESLLASGVYIDSDVEVLRPFDVLLNLKAFAAYEDDSVIPDAVMGAGSNHPAIYACLKEAIRRINTDSTDWRTGRGAWSTGPGTLTAILPGRDDVTLFGREVFYPYGYWEKDRRGEDFTVNPNTLAVHHWHGSWL